LNLKIFPKPNRVEIDSLVLEISRKVFVRKNSILKFPNHVVGGVVYAFASISANLQTIQTLSDQTGYSAVFCIPLHQQ